MKSSQPYQPLLLGWILVVLCIALHVLMNARVGGSALLMSILNWRFRQRDHPTLWYANISGWLSDLRLTRRANWLRFSFPSAEAHATRWRSLRSALTGRSANREAVPNGRLSPTPTNSTLIALEVFVLTSLVAAWIIPLFK